MADARALLRAERASRRITHPHASYTESGKLLCNLCEAPVKSEAHWQSHLHSTQHNLRSQRRQDAAESRGAGKKRKAEMSESPERKRAKPDETVKEEALDETVIHVEGDAGSAAPGLTDRTNGSTAPPQSVAEPVPPGQDDANEADIAADLAALDDLEAEAQLEDQARQRAQDQATITAAPMSAAELAAQAREKQSEQRVKRDEEIEGEREDAARVLEDEMAEREGLEERVAKLRQRREQLRDVRSLVTLTEDKEIEKVVEEGEEPGGGEESSEDEDEDVDEWKFGGK